MTSKLFYIYSVYKNYQILSLQLSSISRVSQTISNKLINTHDFLVSRNNCSYFSCYLFCRLSLIILENVSITFRVTTEWLHFRPYIHPIDHHFTKKKKIWGALAPPGHLPRPPVDLILFDFAKNRCTHIFLDYPLEGVWKVPLLKWPSSDYGNLFKIQISSPLVKDKTSLWSIPQILLYFRQKISSREKCKEGLG